MRGQALFLCLCLMGQGAWAEGPTTSPRPLPRPMVAAQAAPTAEPAPAAPFAHPPFRRVLLAGAEGWAFSKPFRMELANSGLEVRLRPMPDAHDA